jgi:hypothetical protein
MAEFHFQNETAFVQNIRKGDQQQAAPRLEQLGF